MSLFGGIIAGAMQGAGDAGSQIADQTYKQNAASKAFDNETSLTNLRSQLQEAAAMRLAEFNNNLKNAPTDRAGALVADAHGQQVPVPASPVTALDQAGADKTGLTDGIQGNMAKGGNVATIITNMTAILNNPDATAQQKEDAQGALSQINDQFASQKQLALDAVAGKMRGPSSEEALAWAIKKATETGDLQAVATLKAMIPEATMMVGPNTTVLSRATMKPIFSDTSAKDLEQMKESAADIRSKLDRESREKIETLKERDPSFIKELKALYPEGSPEYEAALSARIGKESGVNGGAGGRAAVFNARIIGAGNQVLHAIQNIVDLPMGATSGWMGGYQPGHSLLGAAMGVLKNNLNDQDVQSYNVMKLGLSRSLATMESQGLAPPGSLTSSLDKMDFSVGDTGMTTLRKIAETKQIATAALEQKMNDPTVPAEQRKFVQGLIDGFNRAVPYTHADLTNFQKAQSSNPSLTFNDYAGLKLGTLSQGHAAPAAGTSKPSLNDIFGK